MESKEKRKTKRGLPKSRQLEKAIEVEDDYNSKLGNVLTKVEDLGYIALIAQDPVVNEPFVELLSERARPIGQALCGVAPFNIQKGLLETARYLYEAAGHKDKLEPFINHEITEGAS